MRRMSADEETLEEEAIEAEDRSIAAAKWLLLSPDCPPLPKSVMDSFHSMPEPCPEEEVAIMQKLVIEKLFAKLYPKPIRQPKAKAPFGLYIKETRETIRLHAGDIARFLGRSASYVKDIETGKTLPWQLDPEEVATITTLFRLHAKALRKLVLASISVSQGRAEMDEAVKKAPRPLRKRLTARKDDEIEAATDEFYARSANESLMTDDIERWFKKVIKVLKDRKAIDFID